MRGSVRGIAGGDHPFALEGREIVRCVATMQHLSGVVVRTLLAVKAKALNRFACVVEPPHAEALDLQRQRGELENAAQPIVEAFACIDVTGGQRHQRIALRHQPALAGGKGCFGGSLGRRGRLVRTWCWRIVVHGNSRRYHFPQSGLAIMSRRVRHPHQALAALRRSSATTVGKGILRPAGSGQWSCACSREERT